MMKAPATPLAIVSPWPPAPTGVAEYAATIAEALSRVRPVVRLERSDPGTLRRAAGRLYQLGNNVLHREAYRAALEVPGVAELHDGILHHFLLGELGRERYMDEFVYNLGEQQRAVAEQLWAAGSGAASDERFFRFPMLRRVVERSECVIVHNPAALRCVDEVKQRHGLTTRVVEIPHYAEEPPRLSAEALDRARSEFGIPADRLVIACFGYQRPAKRLRSLLEASRRLAARHTLVIAGDFVDPAYEASLEKLLDLPHVRRIPAVSCGDLWRLAALTDVCVNLRQPSAGETSGIAMKLMSLGKCVIVSDGEEYSRIPPAAVLRVDSGAMEIDLLTEYLTALAEFPEMHETIGRLAAEHVRRRHSLSRVIESYRHLWEGAG